MRIRPIALAFPLLGLLSIVACGGGGLNAPGGAAPALPVVGTDVVHPGKYIKHVVIMIQENRSFENIFAGWPGSKRAPLYGYGSLDGGKTIVRIPMKPVTFEAYDMNHQWITAVKDIDCSSLTTRTNCKMDGFWRTAIQQTGQPGGAYPYSYLDHAQIQPYIAMAQQYSLLDRMFPTLLSESFTAHLDLIAGTTNLSPTVSEIDVPSGPSVTGKPPWGCDAPKAEVTSLLTSNETYEANEGPFPCFTQFRTMADTLDAAHVSWHYYAPTFGTSGWSWDAFQAIKAVRYGPDWANMITPQTNVITDAMNGKLASVNWVVPDGMDSDHPGARSDTGPSWVAAVVNAIGEGPDWDSTAIVLLWDDWGGWFDSEPPPDTWFGGNGIRVPCIVISPYAKKGYVDDTQYEFGSILKFVEDVYGLPTLGTAADGYSDARAKPILNSFKFDQKPRAYVPIPVPYPSGYFMHRPPSGRPLDDD